MRPGHYQPGRSLPQPPRVDVRRSPPRRRMLLLTGVLVRTIRVQPHRARGYWSSLACQSKGESRRDSPFDWGFAPKVATGTVVRQAHHERSFRFTVPPELVEGRLGPLDTSCADPFGGGLGVSPSSLFFPLPGQEGGQGDGRKGASAPSFG